MKDFVEAKKLLESTGHLVVEKREKKTFDTFMTYLMDQDGRCSADGGDHTFYCLKLNDENFYFVGYEQFKAQIEKEGLYDWSWVAGLIPNKELDSQGRVPVSWLPIFGRRDKYETKWLQNGTPSSAVEEVFRDRRMKIKSRIDYFAIPEEDQLSLNDLKIELEKLGLPCRIGSSRKGDFLETNMEFSQEACKRFGDIPRSSGTSIVWLIRNKFVINKRKYGSIEKVVDYFKENKGLYEILESKDINRSGTKVIKESKPNYRYEKAMKITQLLDDTFDYIRYDDALDIGEYFSERVVHYDMTDPDDISSKLSSMLYDVGVQVNGDLAEKLAYRILDIMGL